MHKTIGVILVLGVMLHTKAHALERFQCQAIKKILETGKDPQIADSRPVEIAIATNTHEKSYLKYLDNNEMERIPSQFKYVSISSEKIEIRKITYPLEFLGLKIPVRKVLELFSSRGGRLSTSNPIDHGYYHYSQENIGPWEATEFSGCKRVGL